MPETQVIYFVLALVVLLILFTALTGRDAFGSVADATTQKRTSITVTGAGSDAVSEQYGDLYNYIITTAFHMQISPRPEKDITVVPVMSFKGQHAKAEEFIIRSNEERYDTSLAITITSHSPPLSEESPGSITFTEGQDYIIRAGVGVFKVGMTGVSLRIKFDGIVPQPDCRAKFRIECEDAIRSTSELGVCGEGELNKFCSQTIKFGSNILNKCDGSVTITARENNCGERSSKVDVDVEGGIDWNPADQATLLLFRESDCLELDKDVSSWRGSCADDFLGSYTMDVKYVSAYS